MILKAFEKGADGVMVVGCLEGDCHYLAGNLRARARVGRVADVLDTTIFALLGFNCSGEASKSGFQPGDRERVFAWDAASGSMPAAAGA